jgi:hypothetical protein
MNILKKEIPKSFDFWIVMLIAGGALLVALATFDICVEIPSSETPVQAYSAMLQQQHMQSLAATKHRRAIGTLESQLRILCKERLYEYQIQELAKILSNDCTADISANLILRLIAKESGFDPEAEGKHGEIGLMQLKPTTVHLSTKELLDPVQNVEAGIKHLKDLFRDLGERGLALVAYNGGINMPAINYAIDLLKEK